MDVFKNRQLSFPTDPADAISMRVQGLRLQVNGSPDDVIAVDAGSRSRKSAYAVLDAVVDQQRAPLETSTVMEAKLHAVGRRSPESGRGESRSRYRLPVARLGDSPEEEKLKSYLRPWGIEHETVRLRNCGSGPRSMNRSSPTTRSTAGRLECSSNSPGWGCSAKPKRRIISLCDNCSDPHSEEVIWISNVRSPTGMSPIIGCPEVGAVDVDPERLRQWGDEPPKLAESVAAGLELSGPVEPVLASGSGHWAAAIWPAGSGSSFCRPAWTSTRRPR